MAGRRFGKTFLSNSELLRVGVQAGKKAWYVAPTYRQAKEIAWRDLKLMAGDLIAKKNETDLSIETTGGGTIALRGAQEYDHLRGPGLDFLVIDEYADVPPEAWTEVLRPMLSDRLGGALFIGTPKGKNHFFELYDAAKGLENWDRWQYRTIDGGRVMESEVAAAKGELDERTFRQEYLATFENWAGQAYHAYSDANVSASAVWIPQLPIIWSLDFNVDPMSSVICQRESRAGAFDVVNVIDELVIRNTSTQVVCEVFLERTKKWADLARRRLQVIVYGDPAGNSRMHSGDTDFRIIKQFFARHSDTYDFQEKVRSSADAVRDRVNAVNAKLRSADGVISLRHHPRCKELAKDFQQVQYCKDTAGNTIPTLDKSDGARTHISDALGYFIWAEFPIKGKIGYGREILPL